MAPFRDLAPRVHEMVATMPYPWLTAAFDAIFPKGIRSYWKGNYVTELTDAAIEAHLVYGPDARGRVRPVGASDLHRRRTAFVLPPTTAEADYRVRIFTTSTELSFAGHPTLGTCHAWVAATGSDKDLVVQECASGVVSLRWAGDVLAFAPPPLVRSGPVEELLLADVSPVLGIDRAEIVDAQWADNGPGWVAVLLADADSVLALKPSNTGSLYIGAVGPVSTVLAGGVRGARVLPERQRH
jgi:hypothetical protein